MCLQQSNQGENGENLLSLAHSTIHHLQVREKKNVFFNVNSIIPLLKNELVRKKILIYRSIKCIIRRFGVEISAKHIPSAQLRQILINKEDINVDSHPKKNVEAFHAFDNDVKLTAPGVSHHPIISCLP